MDLKVANVNLIYDIEEIIEKEEEIKKIVIKKQAYLAKHGFPAADEEDEELKEFDEHIEQIEEEIKKMEKEC